MPIIHHLLNFIFPPLCLNCDTRVPENGTLCVSCWQQVQFISEPLCECCGTPFTFSGVGTLCAACLTNRPPFAHARAALRYDEHSRKLITRLKYADQTQLAVIYGTWLAAAGKTLLENADIIIPVPLHYFRFIRRRYNQSALLANMLSQKTGVPTLPDGLQRIRHTAQQTGLSRSERATNVHRAFRIHPRHKAEIKGKNIILLDDVITTGATIEQCTRALLKGGALQVSVLTLARTSDQ